MTDLPLHLVAENATTITFGWEPPAAAVGYYFYADSKRVSNSTNGQQSQVKFKKVASGKYTVTAVGATATGDWPTTPPPPTGYLLPQARLQSDPGGVDPNSGNKGYAFLWQRFKSPTTEVLAQDSRLIVWKTGGLYANNKVVRGTFSWTPEQSDVPGRGPHNLHNPADISFGGYEPPNSHGVSAVSFDWLGDYQEDSPPGLTLTLEDNRIKHYVVASLATMKAALANKTRLDVWYEIGIGRPGHAKVWLDDQNTPVVSITGVNTHWETQTAYMVYEGLYKYDGRTIPAIGTYAAGRFGRTWQEVINDQPVYQSHWGATLPDGTPAYKRTVLQGLDPASVKKPSVLA